jgi:hypothetical protein
MSEVSQTHASGPPPDRWVSGIPAGAAFILMAVGVIFILVQKHEVTVATRMLSWPSATGKSSVSVGLEPLNDGRWGRFIYTAVEYDVAGHTHKASIREYGGLGNTADPPAPGAVKHDSVLIYYDPHNPSDWSLTNDRPASVVLKWLGWLLFTLSLPLWYVAARWYRTPLR